MLTCCVSSCLLCFNDAQALKEMLANPCILEDKKKAVVKSLASEASFSQVGAA